MAVRCTCWESHTYRWPSRAQIETGLSQSVRGTAIYKCDDTRDCVIQFCPPDDEDMCSKHVEAWNKLTIRFSASSWLILINKYIEMHGQQNIKKLKICVSSFANLVVSLLNCIQIGRQYLTEESLGFFQRTNLFLDIFVECGWRGTTDVINISLSLSSIDRCLYSLC